MVIDLFANHSHFSTKYKEQVDTEKGKDNAMKVNVELDCTPEEMRAFMGLPDVSEVNKTYVKGVVDAMQGATNVDQLQNMAKNIAPMGEMGLRFFQQMMTSAMSPSDKSKK